MSEAGSRGVTSFKNHRGNTAPVMMMMMMMVIS